MDLFIERLKMKDYFIYNKSNCNECFYPTLKKEDLRDWMINHLDLSKEWVVRKGYGLDGKIINIEEVAK